MINVGRDEREIRTERKRQLKPYFPNLNLNNIKFNINCALPANFVPFFGINACAMTFGNKIFFNRSNIQNDHARVEDLAILVHELVHSDQYQRMGQLSFAQAYGQQFLQHGYYNMPLENEARALESKFKANNGAPPSQASSSQPADHLPWPQQNVILSDTHILPPNVQVPQKPNWQVSQTSDVITYRMPEKSSASDPGETATKVAQAAEKLPQQSYTIQPKLPTGTAVGMASPTLNVQKRDGSVQSFSQSKLVASITQAGATQPQATLVANRVVNRINTPTVTTAQLSGMVTRSLSKVNTAASQNYTTYMDRKLELRRKT